MLKRRWIIALIGAGTGLLLVLLALPWMVHRVIEQRAAARQLIVDVETVRLRPSRVWLEGVQAQHEELPAVRVELDAVEVRFGWSGLREVLVHGGTIHVAGSVTEVAEQLSRLRGPNREPSVPSSSREPVPIRATGLTVAWPVNAVENYHVWGLSVERDQRGARVAADLLRLVHPLVELDGEALVAELSPRLQVERIASQGMHVGLHLNRVGTPVAAARARLRASAPARAAAGATAAPGAAVPEPAKADDSKTGANGTGAEAAADAAGKREALKWMSLAPERGERLRRVVDRYAVLLARRVAEQRELRFDDVSAEVASASQSLNIGPAQVTLRRTSERLDFSLTTGAPGGGGQRLQLEVALPLGGGAIAAKLQGGPLQLSQLGVRERDFGLVGVDHTELTVEGNASWSESGERAEFSSSGQLRNVSVYHPRLAPAALSGMNLRWEVDGGFALDGSQLELRSGQIALGAVASSVSIDLLRQERQLVVDAELEVPSASCQAMFDSLPKEAVPLLEGMKLSGKFSWRGALRFDTDRLADTEVTWRMRNGCRIDAVPPDARVTQFRRPFVREVPGVDGELMEWWSGPGSDDWVPFSRISRHLPVAVLVTEDGGFWSHSGFSPRAIESAIRQNLEEGRFVRGASTISMQLAKNLYLSRAKHLSRKIQEALLTMLLEQRLSKEEMLELYFNVIEYGPGIYGIGPAARHYFSSTPGELSLAQAFYLASLLPNPKYDRFGADGYLKPSWERYIENLMRIAHQREHISEAELEAGLAERVRFGVPNLLSNPYEMMQPEPVPLWGSQPEEHEGL